MAVGDTAVLRFVNTGLEGAVSYPWEKDAIVFAGEASDTLSIVARDYDDARWHTTAAWTSGKHTETVILRTTLSVWAQLSRSVTYSVPPHVRRFPGSGVPRVLDVMPIT